MNLTVGEILTLFPDHAVRLAPETMIAGVTQDTRKISKGELYVALRGKNFDGHNFVEEAFAKGALLALVERGTPSREGLVYCDDAEKALGRLATCYRKKFNKPVIAVTGSSGKTTCKEMIAHVLSGCGRVVATHGNLNNHIGVPLTIFSFTDEADFFVVEMGMNHAGEIAMLTEVVQPTHGLITSVGRAHVEFFEDGLDGVAMAKGELFSGLRKEATAIVNMDDAFIAKLPTPARRLCFGLSQGTDVRASDISVDGGNTKFVLRHGQKPYHVVLPLVGEHQVRNALASFAVGISLGLPATRLVEGIESFSLEMNRGRLIAHKNLRIMDDTYNANPDSMSAALEALVQAFPDLPKWAILGGMLELGKHGAKLHREVGECAKKLGYERLYAYGALSENYASGFGEGALVFHDQTDMADRIVRDLKPHSGQRALLFKGSRGMCMEKVLEGVLGSY